MPTNNNNDTINNATDCNSKSGSVSIEGGILNRVIGNFEIAGSTTNCDNKNKEGEMEEQEIEDREQEIEDREQEIEDREREIEDREQEIEDREREIEDNLYDYSPFI